MVVWTLDPLDALGEGDWELVAHTMGRPGLGSGSHM